MNPDDVWHLEDVLDLYVEPEDPWYPQVGFDESPVRLTSETRQPLTAQPGQPVRYDTEYQREGAANLFLFVQPLRGWCHVNVTPRRTRADFAEHMRRLADEMIDHDTGQGDRQPNNRKLQKVRPKAVDTIRLRSSRIEIQEGVGQ